MKYYVETKYNKYIYLAGIIAVFSSIGIPLYRGKDVLSVILSSSFIFILFGVQIYLMLKQTKLAIIETTSEKLIINDVRFSKNEVPWDTIIGIQNIFILGYKLSTFSGEVKIPITSLKKSDRDTLLIEFNKRSENISPESNE